MKFNKRWIKELNEKDISALMNEKEFIKKASNKLKERMFNYIDNLDTQYTQKRVGSKNIFSVKNLRPALTCIIIIIILIPVIWIFLLKFNTGFKESNYAMSIESKGQAQVIGKNGLNDLMAGYKIKKDDIIKTGINSNVIIKIGEKTEINLHEKTEMKVLNITSNGKDKSIILYLNRGLLECDVKLPTKGSSFVINTDFLNATIKGTKFSVEISEANQISVNVDEGKVEIDKFIDIYENLEKIKISDEIFYNGIIEIINKKIIIEKGYSFFVNKYEMTKMNNDLNNLIKDVNIKINNGEAYNEIKTNIFNIIDQLSKKKIKKVIEENIDTSEQELSKDTDKIKESDNITEDLNTSKLFLIEKLSNNQTINLSERDTSISTFKNYILICSDFNKSIYCFNSNNGEKVWQFNHEKLKNISSNALEYNDDIVLITSENIFIIDKNGNKKEIYDLNNGLLNWANPVIYKDSILIPTNRNIYQFDGKNILPLENYTETMGQIYISLYNNYLFCLNLNELMINAYDLNEKRVIWKSDKFNVRVFNSPVFTGKYLFIADIKNKIYKYDFDSKEKKPVVIDIETGVLSNIIYYDNCIYFIGNNGCFYKYKLSKLLFKKQIDKNPIREKYFTKKLLKYNEALYFSTDSGEIFNYDLKNNRYNFVKLPQNNKKILLLGSPIQINGFIYTVDSESNIYKIVKTNK